MSNIFQQLQHSGTWDLELQNLYNAEFQHGRSTHYPSQLFTGIGKYLVNLNLVHSVIAIPKGRNESKKRVTVQDRDHREPHIYVM